VQYWGGLSVALRGFDGVLSRLNNLYQVTPGS